jgi:hypothetical protein
MADHDPKTTPPSDDNPTPTGSTEYTKEIGDMICVQLAEGESLRSICSEPGMPNADAVRCWILHHPEFRHSYAFARQFQAHCIADETIELADEMSTEWIEKVRANGRVVRAPDRKNLPRSRLRIGVRQWVADRLLARARQLRAGFLRSGA